MQFKQVSEKTKGPIIVLIFPELANQYMTVSEFWIDRVNFKPRSLKLKKKYIYIKFLKKS